MNVLNMSRESTTYGNVTMVRANEPIAVNVVAISVLLVLVMMFTLFGNGLVLLSFFAQPSLRRAIYLPIISLAIADILCAITAMPLYIVKKNSSPSPFHERLVCDLYRFSYFFTEYASILSLMAISIERFFIIHNPFKYRSFISPRIMVVGLCFCWLEALAVSTMPFYWRSDRAENCTNSPTANWSVMVITVNVFAPFAIMLSCHCYIYLKALTGFHFNSKAGKENPPGGASNVVRAENWKMERKATISFSVVIGVFVLCWGPSTLYYFIRNVCPNCFKASFRPYKDIISASVKFLTFCNSFMNPIIYFWLNVEFREAFARVFRRERASAVRSRSGTLTSLNGVRIQIT